MLAPFGCDELPEESGALAHGAFDDSVRAAPPSFVGSAACASCHTQQMKGWEDSHHALAMQLATEETVRGDFRDVTFTYHGLTSTFFRKGEAFMVRTDGPEGVLHDYEVAYTFGVYPLQQYLIRFPGGRVQALNVCWDTRSAEEGGKRWFHLYPNEEIRHDDILHWTGPYQNWNHMCAECHSTNVHKGYSESKDTFETTWSEISVGCESCHGPGSAHVAWAHSLRSSEKPKDALAMGLVVALKENPPALLTLDPKRGILLRDRPRTDHSQLETCARCHSRRGTFSEEWTPGKPLADTHRLALLEPALFESDGFIMDEVFEHASFLQSKMHAAGVTCTDCHDPHTLKTPPGNLACAKCHVPSVFDTPEHHKHAVDSAAAQCVSCHAPTREFMVVHARHDHSFRVPRPDLSVRLGTPNACNDCHRDQTPAWAADAAEKWWGTARAKEPHYGEVFAAARRGAPNATSALAALLQDSAQPAIVRATAASMLGATGGAVTARAFERALLDQDPQVRAAAARNARLIEGMDVPKLVAMIAPLLSDPIRQVRMDAARELAGVPVEALTAEQASARRRGLDEYRAAEMTNADRAESRLNLGSLALDQGDLMGAEREYLTAIKLSPRFPAAYVNLADLFRIQGREREAEVTIRQGLKMDEKDPVLHHVLGLALIRQQRLDEAIGELTLAQSLAPDDPRYAYVLAVALGSTQRAEEAIALLNRTHLAHPSDTLVLEALVLYLRDAARFDEAVIHAERLVALRPADAETAGLLNQLRAIKAAVDADAARKKQ